VPIGESLKKYANDLTQLARDGKLDPVIGREEEMRRTIEILSRRTKVRPCTPHTRLAPAFVLC
jgi:ATP-dependent Clp protease ATP-binding subunit ClpB